MKKTQLFSLFLIAMLALLSLSGCIDTDKLSELAKALASNDTETAAKADNEAYKPYPEDTVVRICVDFSPPLPNGNDRKIFKSASKINSVMDALRSLELTEDPSGMLETINGNGLFITVTDMHGTEYTYSLSGNRAFKVGKEPSRAVRYEQAVALENICTKNSSDTKELSVNGTLSSSVHFRQAAKAAVCKQFGAEADCLVVTDVLAAPGSTADSITMAVELKLVFAGAYDTGISITVYVSSNGETVISKAQPRLQEYAAYSKYATEPAFEAAIAKMKAPRDMPEQYYMQIDSDNYLCLCYEEIVQIDAAPVQTDEHGYVLSGCGIDHKHVMETQRVCALPVVQPTIN